MNVGTPQAARPFHQRRGLLIAVIGIIAVVILILVLLLGGKKARTGTPPQVVSATAATLGDMPEILNELGTVTPVATVNVLPQLSGYLTAVGYQEGQDVTKGQFLAQIDPRQYEIDKQQAEAQLAKDQASLDQARADLARYTQLHEQKSIAEQTYAEAGIGPEDVDALLVYDSFSPHIMFALEGFGYCRPGEAARFIAENGIGVGGKLPINTHGGHLSESYMQGWSHQVEAVRQVRGGLGARQVQNCRFVQYTSDVAGKAMSIIYGR